MFITNNPEIAKILNSCGVERVWIDLETLGKEERQGHLDSVKSHHTVEDISKIKPLLTTSSLQVRINPINPNSATEIELVLQNGADYIMLPMFRTKEEVQFFVNCVKGRAKTILLLETDTAAEHLDEILWVNGIDEIHIGLNDLHLCYKKKFMFELLADGTVEKIISIIKKYNIPYGFGGVSKLGTGTLGAEYILGEHVRLGSTRVILSRSFCNTKDQTIEDIRKEFPYEFSRLVAYEKELQHKPLDFFVKNKLILDEKIKDIVNGMGEKNGN